MSVIVALSRRQCAICHRWFPVPDYLDHGAVCGDCRSAGFGETAEEEAEHE